MDVKTTTKSGPKRVRNVLSAVTNDDRDVSEETVKVFATHNQVVSAASVSPSADGAAVAAHFESAGMDAELGRAKITPKPVSAYSAADTTCRDVLMQHTRVASPYTVPCDLPRPTHAPDSVFVLKRDEGGQRRLPEEFDPPKTVAGYDWSGRVGIPVYDERPDSARWANKSHSALNQGDPMRLEGCVDCVDVQPSTLNYTAGFSSERLEKVLPAAAASLLTHSSLSTLTPSKKVFSFSEATQLSPIVEQSRENLSGSLAGPEEQYSVMLEAGVRGSCAVDPDMLDMQTKAARVPVFTYPEDHLGNLSAPLDCDVTRRWTSNVVSSTESDGRQRRSPSSSISSISESRHVVLWAHDEAPEVYSSVAVDGGERLVAAIGSPHRRRSRCASPAPPPHSSEPHGYGSLSPHVNVLSGSFYAASAATPLTMTSPDYPSILGSAVAFFDFHGQSGVGGPCGDGGTLDVAALSRHSRRGVAGVNQSFFESRPMRSPHRWLPVAVPRVAFVEGAGGRPVTSLRARAPGISSSTQSRRFRTDEDEVHTGPSHERGSYRGPSLIMLDAYLQNRHPPLVEQQDTESLDNRGCCSTAMSGCGEGSLRVASDASMLRPSFASSRTISSIESVGSYNESIPGGVHMYGGGVSSHQTNGEQDSLLGLMRWGSEANEDECPQPIRSGAAAAVHQTHSPRDAVRESNGGHSSVVVSGGSIPITSDVVQYRRQQGGYTNSRCRSTLCSAVDIPDSKVRAYLRPGGEPLDTRGSNTDCQRPCTVAKQKRGGSSQNRVDSLAGSAAGTPFQDPSRSRAPLPPSSALGRRLLSGPRGFSSTFAQPLQRPSSPADAARRRTTFDKAAVAAISTTTPNALEDALLSLPTREKSASPLPSTPLRSAPPISGAPARCVSFRLPSGGAEYVGKMPAIFLPHTAPALPRANTPGSRAHRRCGRFPWSGFTSTSVVTTGCFFTESNHYSSHLPAILLGCGGEGVVSRSFCAGGERGGGGGGGGEAPVK